MWKLEESICANSADSSPSCSTDRNFGRKHLSNKKCLNSCVILNRGNKVLHSLLFTSSRTSSLLKGSVSVPYVTTLSSRISHLSFPRLAHCYLASQIFLLQNIEIEKLFWMNFCLCLRGYSTAVCSRFFDLLNSMQ